MTQTIETTRFGAVEVADESVVEFPSGLIGLGGRRYAIIPHDEEGTFVWLQSLEDPDVALPATNPWLFFPEWEAQISDGDAERIGLNDPGKAAYYVTVRAGGRPEDFRANLRAPIVIVGGRGWQLINELDAPVQAPLFAEVESADSA
jgi:flagellar assembly factor FliW